MTLRQQTPLIQQITITLYEGEAFYKCCIWLEESPRPIREMRVRGVHTTLPFLPSLLTLSLKGMMEKLGASLFPS